MSIPIVYIAGPMTGLPKFNYPLFESTAHMLRRAGFTVLSPTENGLPPSAAWERHMRRDLRLLLDCQGVVVLPGWEASRGASLEVSVARELGMPVRTVDEWMGKTEVAAG